MIQSPHIHGINIMDIEEFKQSVKPRQLRLDDTDTLKEGMVVFTKSNPEQPLMVYSVLDELFINGITLSLSLIHSVLLTG